MRYVVLTVLMLSVLVARAETYTAAQAKAHVGETATVCGIAASVHTAAQSRGEPTFINLDSAYPAEVFTALVWGSDRPAIGALPALRSHVCVNGLIETYRGVPQIVVRRAGQFTK